VKPIAAIDAKFDDSDLEQAHRNHELRIKQLAGRPAVHLEPLGEITLPDGVEVNIPHPLGRAPVQVLFGPIRGASAPGRIAEVRLGTNAITLQADDWGATIKLRVSVL
jgi:hypothetical protein